MKHQHDHLLSPEMLDTQNKAQSLLEVLKENLDFVVRTQLSLETSIKSCHSIIDRNKILIEENTLKLESYVKIEASLLEQINHQESILDALKESIRT